MNNRIAFVAASGLAIVGLAGCFYPPDTQPVPSPTTSEPEEFPLTADETAKLRGLHTITLKKFLEAPDFGLSRMRTPPVYVVPSDVLVSTPPGGAPTPNQQNPSQLVIFAKHHGNTKAEHVNLTKTLRVDRDVAGLQLDQLGVRFEQVQLMGIAKQPEPTVFDIKEDTPAEGRPTRPLDAFEQRGLAKLQANSTLYVEQVQGQMRVLAPIFAGATCVSCHNKQGELLGAFSYTLASTGTKVMGK
jgi:hypothetical protein